MLAGHFSNAAASRPFESQWASGPDIVGGNKVETTRENGWSDVEVYVIGTRHRATQKKYVKKCTKCMTWRAKSRVLKCNRFILISILQRVTI